MKNDDDDDEWMDEYVCYAPSRPVMLMMLRQNEIANAMICFA